MKINVTRHFKRAYKTYKKKHYPMKQVSKCIEAIQKNDTIFLKRHKDHHLFSEIRELHIDRTYNDDWLLIYSFNADKNELVLVLVDMGTHNHLNQIKY